MAGRAVALLLFHTLVDETYSFYTYMTFAKILVFNPLISTCKLDSELVAQKMKSELVTCDEFIVSPGPW